MNPLSKAVRALSQSRFPSGGERDREFLQHRCAFFGKVVGVLATVFYLVGLGSHLLGTGFDWSGWMGRPASYLGLINPVLLFAMGWACSRGTWSHLALNLFDGVAFVLLIGIAVLNSRQMDHRLADGAMVLVFTNALMFRAVVIPSTGPRTLAIGVLCSVPVGLSFLFPPADNGLLVVGSEAQQSEAVTIGMTWLLIGLVIPTLTSRVIYGLRREVAKAMELGQYRLEEKLGAGGMGEVYRARHAMLRRPTAIKLMRPDQAGEDAVARFEAEVQLTAGLNHPNTIAIYDYGRTADNVFYYAMEHLEGYSLEDLVEQHGSLPPARVIHVLRQVSASLEEAHGVGLIHRDIKPANIFLTSRGGIPDVVKVLDFGLVKEIVPDEKAVHLTADNMMVGTPQYMAPETMKAADLVGPATDLYAVGCVGYFLLTGQTVFTASTVMEMCSHHLTSTPEPPSARRHAVPRDLEAVIMQCLEKEPARRPADARALGEALSTCADAGRWEREHAERWWKRNPPPASQESSGTGSFAESLDGSLGDEEDGGTVIVDPSRS